MPGVQAWLDAGRRVMRHFANQPALLDTVHAGLVMKLDFIPSLDALMVLAFGHEFRTSLAQSAFKK